MQNTNSDSSEHKEHIKAAGLKTTKLRIEILDLLLSSKRPLSIQQMTKTINNSHFVSIYRSVYAMQRSGLLKMIPHGFKTLFEPSDIFKPHHHHITCDKCSIIVAVNDDDIETKIHNLSKKSGFIPTKHHLEMYGLCKNCAIGNIPNPHH